MVKQPYIKSLLPIVIAILAISLISITGCTKQGPFIPEFIQPPDKYYIEITSIQIDDLLYWHLHEPAAVMRQWQGKRLIVKNIKVTEVGLNTLHEDYIILDNIKCIPQKPADLRKLKEGDVIDLIGVFVDIPMVADVHIGIVVLANCQFLTTDVYPLPLSVGEMPAIVY
jgi:hypothetical protein